MPYTEQSFLYEHNAFITKTNLKAKLDYGDQEYAAQEMCYKHIQSYRNAIDIGARYGGWSRNMANKFQHLYAFEPRARWLFVFPLNIKMDNTTLYPYGLGDKEEVVNMLGNRIMNHERAIEVVNVKVLDDFKFQDIDFIKIDTDGYELKVLQGGTKTILQWKPIICMEVIPGFPLFGELAEEYLISLGAKKIDEDPCNQRNHLFGW